jgi:hypothetical protein
MTSIFCGQMAGKVRRIVENSQDVDHVLISILRYAIHYKVPAFASMARRM